MTGIAGISINDPTLTQLTLFSILMAYFWLAVLLAFTVTVLLRRRRLFQLELAYQSRSLPVARPVRIAETQEITPVQFHQSATQTTHRVEPDHAASHVTLEIFPDAEAPTAVNPAEGNLQRLLMRMTERMNSTSQAAVPGEATQPNPLTSQH